VLDASIALSWCFGDEASPETEAILRSLGDTYAEVPALFPFEVQNILRQGERRGRITKAEIDVAWMRFQILDIRIEPYLSLTSIPQLADVARTYNLTGYDAAYLDLAMRRSLPLATKDGALRVAAVSCFIPLIL
jgi:predicted nucleic acid-binding protein